MDEDDLPPKPLEEDAGFSGELGQTFAWFVGIAIFLGVAGLALYAVTRWL